MATSEELQFELGGVMWNGIRDYFIKEPDDLDPTLAIIALMMKESAPPLPYAWDDLNYAQKERFVTCIGFERGLKEMITTVQTLTAVIIRINARKQEAEKGTEDDGAARVPDSASTH